MTSIRKPLAALLHLPATGLIALIGLYQKTLSPDHGPLKHLHPHGYCRHEPTCSEYAKRTLRARALPLALALILWRVLSCNPFTKISDEKLRTVVTKHLER